MKTPWFYTEVAQKRNVPESAIRRGEIVKLVDETTLDFAAEALHAMGETIAAQTVFATAIPDSSCTSEGVRQRLAPLTRLLYDRQFVSELYLSASV